jgi:hypothetical protein
MAIEYELPEVDKTFDVVQKNEGYSKEVQIEGLKWMGEIGKKRLDVIQELGVKTIDLLKQREANEIEREKISLLNQNSMRNYDLAKDRLDCIRAVLKNYFSNEEKMIEKGFKDVDKAIEAGEWEAAVGFFGKMADMVSKSPLADAIAFSEKMKSDKFSLDDF